MHTIIAVDNVRYVGIGYADGRPAWYVRYGSAIRAIPAHNQESAVVDDVLWVVVDGRWLQAEEQ